MNKIEDILNESLEMLDQGKSQEQILAKFKDAQNDLAPLLQISSKLKNVPTNIVPTPLMQRKYANKVARGLFHLSRFATFALAISFIVSGVVATGVVANQSSPGDTLFAVKKTTEKFPLVFTFNQDARASLEIQIAQKRLDEAQIILNDPTKAPEQKTAVLAELTSQTSTAIAEVNTITKSNPKSKQAKPLISSLDSIAKQQQELLAQIKPEENTEIQTATSKALESLTQNAVQISQIKNTVAIADNDQSMAALASNPDSVAILGKVTKLADNQVTVEKTAFTLTAQTIIQNLKGTILSYKDLELNQRVNVTGVKNSNDTNTAKLIIITDEPQKGEVQGDATSTPAQSPIEPTVTPVPTTTPTQNSTSGSFILEDPAPQFAN